MTPKSAQQIQDDIFKKMSADRKLEVGAQLWKCAQDLVGDKLLTYDGDGTKRSAVFARKHR